MLRRCAGNNFGTGESGLPQTRATLSLPQSRLGLQQFLRLWLQIALAQSHGWEEVL
jgi:hypothetical protein